MYATVSVEIEARCILHIKQSVHIVELL